MKREKRLAQFRTIAMNIARENGSLHSVTLAAVAHRAKVTHTLVSQYCEGIETLKLHVAREAIAKRETRILGNMITSGYPAEAVAEIPSELRREVMATFYRA